MQILLSIIEVFQLYLKSSTRFGAFFEDERSNRSISSGLIWLFHPRLLEWFHHPPKSAGEVGRRLALLLHSFHLPLNRHGLWFDNEACVPFDISSGWMSSTITTSPINTTNFNQVLKAKRYWIAGITCGHKWQEKTPFPLSLWTLDEWAFKKLATLKRLFVFKIKINFVNNILRFNRNDAHIIL